MKSGVVAGAGAGVVGGIVGLVFGVIGSQMGLYRLSPLPITYLVSTAMVLIVIFGAIFGAIYVKFYDAIPGKGVSKGLYFGLMIWLINSIAPGAHLGIHSMEFNIAIRLVFVYFFVWISYGPVLGVLYKK